MRTRSLAAVPALLAAGALISVASSTPHSAARAASFNCNQAAAPSEFAICGDPQLSSLDSAIGVAYAQRLAQEPSIRQIQRGWLKARNVGCGKDRTCLRLLMTDELGWLRSGLRLSPALPSRVGACSVSTVTQVATRLDGTPGSGSDLREANGAAQVSYDQIPAADASRLGDPALVCLVALPSDCPPGDDRGKTYAVANLRTLGAWSAPDSEHMCGGA
ncbi:MAG TPA: hypothetical protein VN814_23605 [Caulobacteraceae bacterium]|nr:hypothetical protein [Caulobacteraceae bacterium]